MGARIEERPDGMVIQGLGRQGEQWGADWSNMRKPWRPSRVSVAIGVDRHADDSRFTILRALKRRFPGFDGKLLELLTDSGNRL